MKDKTILILGLGHNQKDLVLAAKEYGANVIACAKNTEGPAKAYVDEYREIDILDVDAITRYAEEKNVSAVYTLGLEAAIEPIAVVSERLGLNAFVSSSDFEKLKNKGVWRAALGEITGNLPFQTATNIEELYNWNIYPAVVKPVDGSGQRGVVRVENKNELEENFDRSKSFSRSGAVIVEKFAEGDEISVNSFMYKGKLAFAAISDRYSHNNLPGGIIKEHHIPSIYDSPNMATKINALVEDVNQIIGFENGHVYFQIKIHGDKISLIEFTPRFDGCHMWRLIRNAYGLNLLQVTLECLLEGESETLETFAKRNVSEQFILKFNSDKPGTVVDYENYYVPSDVQYNYWYYSEGECVKPVTGILEKVGYYIVAKERGQ